MTIALRREIEGGGPGRFGGFGGRFGGAPGQPLLNAPGVIRWILYVTIAMHVLRQLLSMRADGWIVLKLAYIPARYTTPGGLDYDLWATILSPVGYALLHANLLHLFVNMAFLLAFGSVIARRMTPKGFLVFYALGAVAGALGYHLTDPQSVGPLIGASGAVSAMVGAVAITSFFRFGGAPPPGPLANPRTARFFVLTWLVITVLFGVIPGELLGVEGQIAWQAHLGGFLAGVVLSPFFFRKGPPPGMA
ncbi:MAG: rhomboid family intramembrane serine protease [Alphaproteobacteria bacterium]|nr:rhomboid family intramembrane serine protease [Alphaproteobacteria bacterium]